MSLSYLGKLGAHSISLPFPLWEKSRASKISLGRNLCFFGGGMMLVKLDCSSCPLQCVQTHIVLIQLCLGTSLEIKTSTKAFSIVNNCLTVFSRSCRSWLRGDGACSVVGNWLLTLYVLTLTMYPW